MISNTLNKTELQKLPLRDMGLDFVRALALLLMVSIHYARPIPDVNGFVRAIKFVGESAPAFFFFAFGMTMDIFLRKDDSTKFLRLTSFLYISLIHNIFVKETYVTGFFFILWVWQVLIFIVERFTARPIVTYCAVSIATVLAMAALPFGHVSTFFSFVAIPGFFPILPWGLFVIAGHLFSRYRTRIKPFTLYIALVFIISSIGSYFLYRHFGGKSLDINKWPITLPYLGLFIGINILLIDTAGKYENFFTKIPAIRRPMIFISKNLLLAAVLSYFPCSPVMYFFKKLFSPNIIIENASLFLLAGSFLCILTVFVLIKLFIVVWDMLQNSRPVSFVHSHFDIFACLVIIACSLSMGITRLTLYGPGSYLFSYDSFFRGNNTFCIYNLLTGASVFFMVYFALEMGYRRKLSHINNNSSPGFGSIKINITITLILFCFAFSTRFAPDMLERFYLMHSDYPDSVPSYIQKGVAYRLSMRGIYVDWLKPEEPLRITDELKVFPYRCIIKKKEENKVAIDSVLLFACFDDGKRPPLFKRAEFVSYTSYASDLDKKGKPFLKSELHNLFKTIHND